MDRTYNILGLFSGSTLKIFACAFMLIDHIGLVFYDYSPEVFEVFRIFGRLAFPIFAFFIAEGTRHSRHKWQRLATIFSIGLVFFLFYYFYDGRLYGNIFLTFSVYPTGTVDFIIITASGFMANTFAITASTVLVLK